MKILAIRTCSADLFEINARRLLRQYPAAEVTFVGDSETIRRIPKSSNFSTYQINAQAALDIFKFLLDTVRTPFDLVFYGHNDRLGYSFFFFEIFFLLMPWRRAAIAQGLDLHFTQSHFQFFLRWAKKLLLIFLPMGQTNRSLSQYQIGFTDELLAADQPAHFSFDGSSPDLLKKTVNDETRSCFSVSSSRPVMIKIDPDASEFSIGAARNSASASDAQLEISLLQNQNMLDEVRQPVKTFLPEWNDHSFNLKLKNHPGAHGQQNYFVKCSVQGNGEAALSFPKVIKRKRGKKIVVLILDALNLNHLGIYNPVSSCSPFIDQYFGDGLKYTAAFSQEVWTRPAFASFATSYYPSHHQVLGKNFFQQVPSHLPNLADELRRNGYHTCGYVSHRLANQLYGHSRGFDRFVWRQTGENPFFNARDIVSFGLETLHQNRNNDLFMFLHFFDTHHPFFPRSPYNYSSRRKDFRDPQRVYHDCFKKRKFSAGDREFMNQAAMDKLTEVDFLLEPLFSKLTSKDFVENTSVILTSDHGFLKFSEDAILDTGTYRLVSEMIQVPLLVRSPGIRKQTIDRPVESNIDLFPSVLDLAAIEADHSDYSKSYIPNQNGMIDEKKYAVSECVYGEVYQLSIRSNEECFYLRCKKDIVSMTFYPKLYWEEMAFDLKSDPSMKHNLIPGNPALSEKFKELRQRLGLVEFLNGHIPALKKENNRLPLLKV